MMQDTAKTMTAGIVLSTMADALSGKALDFIAVAVGCLGAVG